MQQRPSVGDLRACYTEPVQSVCCPLVTSSDCTPSDEVTASLPTQLETPTSCELRDYVCDTTLYYTALAHAAAQPLTLSHVSVLMSSLDLVCFSAAASSSSARLL